MNYLVTRIFNRSIGQLNNLAPCISYLATINRELALNIKSKIDNITVFDYSIFPLNF